MSAGADWCFRHDLKRRPDEYGSWRCTLCDAEREPSGVARVIEEAEQWLARWAGDPMVGVTFPVGRTVRLVRSLLAALREAEGRTMSDGARMIVEERARQVHEEGWTAAHDDDHMDGEISGAACAYAEVACRQVATGITNPGAYVIPNQMWRWEHGSWKPSPDPIRNLTKAGALIAAEIDRLLRRPTGDEP